MSRTLAGGIAPATHVLVERLAALLDRRDYPDMPKRFGEVAPLYAAQDA